MNTRLYGTTGKLIRVDLTEGRIWEEALAEDVIKKYLGGTSLGAKCLYEEVNPKISWSDPQNHVYLFSGPLGGARIAGSGCFSAVTKGVHTGGVTSTQANGNFGAYLKFSGFEGIAIHGASQSWKYLYIHDGKAELKDADHLLGKDTWETEDAIKEELGFKEGHMSVFSIGPAGENLVKFAGIHGDRGHTAAHNGIGAVLGSKKLKAVAVSRSRGKVEVADTQKLKEAYKALVENFKKAAGGEIYKWGTSRVVPAAAKGGILPVKNYTTALFPQAPDFDVRERFETHRAPCIFCPSFHHMHIKITEGQFSGFEGKEPEYEQYAAFGPQIGQPDPAAAIILSNDCDRLGFDTNELGWILGWVMECYERGLLSAKDLDGLEMTWGNVDATRALMKNIAARRGFGDVLAEGIKLASEKVGGEAKDMAIFTQKGCIPRGHDHRTKWWEFLDTCVSESGTLQNQLLMLDLSPYGLNNQFDGHSWEEVSTIEGKTTGTLTFVDSLVICWFACSGNIPLLCDALNAATGWAFTFDQALEVGRRAVTLMRAYNIRAGISSKLDRPSTRYGSTPPDGPGQGLSVLSHLDDMLRNYYKHMGWDPNTGVPTPETLEKLGLKHVIGDLA